MKGTDHFGGDRFRVWIARYQRWRPGDYRDVPPTAVAVEPAEPGTMSGEEAATYVAAFNRSALGRSGNLWAVALPVKVWYQGEPRPGEIIEVQRRRIRTGRAHKKRPPRICQASTREGPPPRVQA
jgi:hypothetical protein